MDEELVILVEDYPALYNLSHKDYDNNAIKDNIWRDIAEKLHKPVEECKSKWALLRSYFVRARNRRKTTTGQAAKKIKKWRLEDQMQYLIPFLQERESRSSLEQETEEDAEEDIMTVQHPSPTAVPSPSPSPSPGLSVASANSSGTTRGITKKRGNTTSGLETALTNFITSKSGFTAGPPDPKKPLMTFFEDIAESLLKFPEVDRVELKQEIFNLVSRREIDMLRRRESNVPGGPSSSRNLHTLQPPTYPTGHNFYPVDYPNQDQVPTTSYEMGRGSFPEGY